MSSSENRPGLWHSLPSTPKGFLETKFSGNTELSVSAGREDRMDFD